MACLGNDSPIDIDPKKYSGECQGKCDYSFDYHSSSCIVTNRGNYLEIAYELTSSAAPPVSFNNRSYAVSDVRVYTPSLHTFGGERMGGEMVIVHRPLRGGDPLLVCVPIRVASATVRESSSALSKISRVAATQIEGDSAPVQFRGGDPFTLNFFVPQAPFFIYRASEPFFPCSSQADIIVFGPRESLGEMTDRTRTAIAGALREHNINARTSDVKFYFNPTGSRRATSAKGAANFYIECDKTEGGCCDGEDDDTAHDREIHKDRADRSAMVVGFFILQIFIGILIFGIVVIVFLFLTGKMDLLNKIPWLGMLIPHFNFGWSSGDMYCKKYLTGSVAKGITTGKPSYPKDSSTSSWEKIKNNFNRVFNKKLTTSPSSSTSSSSSTT